MIAIVHDNANLLFNVIVNKVYAIIQLSDLNPSILKLINQLSRRHL